MEHIKITINAGTTASSSSSDVAAFEQAQTLSTASPPSSPAHQLGHSSSQKPRFQCTEPDCLRLFNRKYTLTEHLKTHTGEKPYVCSVLSCGKRFATSGNLSRHKRVHGPVLPSACPVPGCECSFANDVKLEKHMKFHLGTAEHVCLVPGCGKTFSTFGNHNRHMRNQHTREERLWANGQVRTPTRAARSSTASPNCSDDWSHSSGSGSGSEDDEYDSLWWSPGRVGAPVVEPLDRFAPREPWNPEMLEALSLMLEE